MYLKNNKIYISENNTLFDLETMDIFTINDEYKNNFIFAEMGENYSFEVKQYLQNRKETINQQGIKTIRINVCHACNLKCSYCYASQGNYGETKLMTLECAKNIVNFINTYFNEVETIIFFGGEPTLNYDVIKYICEHMEEKNFLMQTNGVKLNDKNIIKLIQDYNISITLSVDGNKEIHDLNRITNKGKPTFDLIKDNVNKLNEKYGIFIQTIEATMPSVYLKNNEKGKIAEELFENFKCKNIIIHEVLDLNLENNINNIKEEWTENTVTILNRLLDDKKYIIGEDLYMALIPFFSKKTENQLFCTAAKGIISIDPDGNLWPCHMFVKSNYQLGNINDFKKEKFKSISDKFHGINKNNSICQSCIAKYYCHKCAKRHYSKSWCDRKKEETKLVLEFLSEHKNDINSIAERFI